MYTDAKHVFDKTLAEIRDAGLWKHERILESRQAAHIQVAGHWPSPTSHPDVRTTMQGIRRTHGTAQQRKSPLGTKELRRLMRVAGPTPLAEARDPGLLVDRAQRIVVTPLQQVGTLDLIDKSTPAANTVGIQAVVNNVTVLAYDASGAISGGNFTFSAKGYVSDATTRLDFDLSQSFSTSTGLKKERSTGRRM